MKVRRLSSQTGPSRNAGNQPKYVQNRWGCVETVPEPTGLTVNGMHGGPPTNARKPRLMHLRVDRCTSVLSRFATHNR
jgi:hypothetical protein